MRASGIAELQLEARYLSNLGSDAWVEACELRRRHRELLSQAQEQAVTYWRWWDKIRNSFCPVMRPGPRPFPFLTEEQEGELVRLNREAEAAEELHRQRTQLVRVMDARIRLLQYGLGMN